MQKLMETGKVFVWMQLLGFDRDDPDKGVARYIQQAGFTPDGICALVFHPDIVHQHRGMQEEYELPRDVCAYYGIPRNVQRERQPWTNYDLRALAENLHRTGTELYMGIMGVATDNDHHWEWINDHPEVLYVSKYNTVQGARRGGLNALKRFRDGTYYEDFFIDQLCQALLDYGFDGVQLTDAFCPMPGTRCEGDFSIDMVEQFERHTGCFLPEELRDADDSSAQMRRRCDWIWANRRREWLRFYAWRWEQFFRKLCQRVHEIGKKVIVLGMYCTDPFESMYTMGFDMAGVFRAGVDYAMPNILPSSVYSQSPEGSEYHFHRYMSIVPLLAAQVQDGHFLSVLGVQDASEEWDMLHHAPNRLERDLYTMLGYRSIRADGTRRCMEGLMLCLGDGIREDSWCWLRERIRIAFSADGAMPVSLTVVWSDAAHEAMLDAYIQTRRWTHHQFLTEMAKRGAICAGSARIEDVEYCRSALFVPNIDLMPMHERETIAAYTHGPVFVTASADFDFAGLGIRPELEFSDPYSDYPLKACVWGMTLQEETRARVRELLTIDGGEDTSTAPDCEQLLVHRMPFQKVAEGFARACAAVLKTTGEANTPFRCEMATAVFQMPDGRYRLYVYNSSEEKYLLALVQSERPMETVRVVSKFPVLPPRFVDDLQGGFSYVSHEEGEKYAFRIRLPFGGVSIVDVTLRGKRR